MWDFRGTDAEPDCTCAVAAEDDRLIVDASGCPGRGDLATEPACRETVVEALGRRAAATVRVERDGVSIRYAGRASTLLVAAGQFAERVVGHDADLAERARSAPLLAADDAAGRIGPVREIADETGLAGFADEESIADSLRGRVGPSIAAARIDPAPPLEATLRSRRVIDSGATVRVYDRPSGPPVYHLEPLEYALGDDALATLAAAWASLADRPATDRAIHRAVRDVANPDQPLHALGRALEKHARGYGVLDDLFADPRIDEVAVNAPVGETPLRVRLGGRAMATNVRLAERGADLLAARVRRESGRPFSRADPTVDALLTDVGSADAVRVAGVHAPASDGLAFALRAEATDDWRLSTLVGLDTITPTVAGLLSFAMARGAAVLVAGPRGAGKTTLASALLWELPRATRLLAIEDTPELPVPAIQAAGHDAQRLLAAADGAALDPADALRTALRLGDGAIAVGEVRGSEARVLYEAMRVGAASSAVLGTIHGEGAAGVRERVVEDLGVPESSFRSTDLVVTIVPDGAAKRVASVEEITAVGAHALYERGPDGLVSTGRLERGNSEFLAAVAGPAETYADARSALADRMAPFGTPSDSPGESATRNLDGGSGTAGRRTTPREAP